MNRVATSTRGSYIKLKSLIHSYFREDGKPEIRFSSPVQWILSVDSSKIPPSVGDAYRGKLNAINEAVIDVIMPPPGHYNDPLEHRLVVPLELINAAWVEFSHPTRDAYLTLSLNAAIQWNNRTWSIITK